MKITQCHTVLQFFAKSVLRKYGLQWYHDIRKPAIFWGCYPASQRKVVSHLGLSVIVWRGSDAARLKHNPSFIQWCKDRPEKIKHIAISNFIAKDLDDAGLFYRELPLSSMDMSTVFLSPRGPFLYAYVGNPESGNTSPYKKELCQEVSKKTHIPLILANVKSFKREQLIKNIYPQTFLGLRLIDHDGLSNSVCELGMAGRNVVYNGSTPNALPYRDTQDIIEIVKSEHALRNEDNSLIRQRMVEFLDVGNEWLNTNYYV